MKYIKVKQDLYARGSKNGYNFVKNELITFKSFEKICKACDIDRCKLLHYKNSKFFEFYEINQQKTFWFFGCRFADE